MNLRFMVIALVSFLVGAGLVVYGLFAYMNPRIVVNWSTATEFETAGFAVYRSESTGGPFTRVSGDLIPASPDPLEGGDYEFVDSEVVPGRTYFYELEEVEFSGATNREGPITATASRSGIAEGVIGLILAGMGLYLASGAPARRRAV